PGPGTRTSGGVAARYEVVASECFRDECCAYRYCGLLSNPAAVPWRSTACNFAEGAASTGSPVPGPGSRFVTPDPSHDPQTSGHAIRSINLSPNCKPPSR